VWTRNVDRRAQRNWRDNETEAELRRRKMNYGRHPRYRNDLHAERLHASSYTAAMAYRNPTVSTAYNPCVTFTSTATTPARSTRRNALSTTPIPPLRFSLSTLCSFRSYQICLAPTELPKLPPPSVGTMQVANNAIVLPLLAGPPFLLHHQHCQQRGGRKMEVCLPEGRLRRVPSPRKGGAFYLLYYDNFIACIPILCPRCACTHFCIEPPLSSDVYSRPKTIEGDRRMGVMTRNLRF
jgi:hypothetical protein